MADNQPPQPTARGMAKAMNVFSPENDPTIQRIRALSDAMAPRRLGIDGRPEDPNAPQGLDYLSQFGPDNAAHAAQESARYQRLGREAGYTSPEQYSAMHAFNMGQHGQSDYAPTGDNAQTNRYGTGSVHNLQPGETPAPSLIDGAPAQEFFNAHPQPDMSKVTSGDLRMAARPGQEGENARQYVSANSSPSHPRGPQAIDAFPWQKAEESLANRVMTRHEEPVMRQFPPSDADPSMMLPLTKKSAPKYVPLSGDTQASAPTGQAPSASPLQQLNAMQALSQPEQSPFDQGWNGQPMNAPYHGGLDTRMLKHKLGRFLQFLNGELNPFAAQNQPR